MIWHYALNAIAALLLVAIGAPLTWAAVRARASSARGRGAVTFPIDSTTPLLRIAAGLSYAAAAIHMAVVPEHFAESAPEGIAFGVLALFQIATGALLQVGSSDRSKVAIIAVNLGATLMWVITRTTGLPFISELALPEAIALRDVAATAFELGIAAVLLGLPRWKASEGRFASIASVSLVPVLGLVGISTLLAVAGPASVH